MIARIRRRILDTAELTARSEFSTAMTRQPSGILPLDHPFTLGYSLLMSIILGIQAILAVLLSLVILLQHRASGLSAALGGTGTTYVQRRGAEKFLYQATVIFGVLFFALIVVQWYV